MPMSSHSFNNSSGEDSTTSLGSPFQCLIRESQNRNKKPEGLIVSKGELGRGLYFCLLHEHPSPGGIISSPGPAPLGCNWESKGMAPKTLETQNPRIMKVGKDLQGHEVQPVTDPHLLSQPRALSAMSSPSLDTSWDGYSTISFPGQPLPMSDHPFHEEILPEKIFFPKDGISGITHLLVAIDTFENDTRKDFGPKTCDHMKLH
ncbi:hypothetical protein BTVI_90413 [Pitangus sulphuratus]|nr:hypothetical protein BTVI_90413 [Pitangus sulphuratus]